MEIPLHRVERHRTSESWRLSEVGGKSQFDRDESVGRLGARHSPPGEPEEYDEQPKPR
jgi:hypothetical protein